MKSNKSRTWLVDLASLPASRTPGRDARSHLATTGWQRMSAVEIMERLESGEYDTEVIIKAGEASRPHPIRGSLRELVWESRTMQRLLNTHVRPDGLYLDIVDRAPIPTALSDRADVSAM